MSLVIGVTGPSNAGKTTLIEHLTQVLVPENKVVVVKHDPGDKATFDQKGKDSFRFFHSGADVVVVSPGRTTFFSHRRSDLKRVLQIVGDFDYLFVEGLKIWNLPRIGVFRFSVDESYLSYIQAIVVVEDLLNQAQQYNLPTFVNDDTAGILEWINTNGLKID